LLFFPKPLETRLPQLAARPHTYLPIHVFAEADKPSQLFQYYLIDTTGFQPNIFTARIPGINDNAIPTAANEANCGQPSIGAVRLVVEPKPGLPTDPNDPHAFIDIFMDVSGLFVINNETGWYEGWMIHDLVLPPVAAPRKDGSGQRAVRNDAGRGRRHVEGDGYRQQCSGKNIHGRRHCRAFAQRPAKAANDYHFKTGQRERRPGHCMFYPAND